jgi:hypothetical protein
VLEHLWCWDEPRATSNSQDSPRPELKGSHHLPPYSILYNFPQRFHPNGFFSQDSQMGVSKSPRLELLRFCGTIISCADLQSGWGLKRSCSLCQGLSNDVLHATCTQGHRVDFRLFVVGNQIVNLTPGLSFDHNLCFRCPNGSCEPISNIFVSINFQWYKEFFKAMGFDLCNCSLKIQESARTPTPNVGAHLGVWVFILTLFHTPGSLFWPALLQTLALVVSSRLGLWH